MATNFATLKDQFMGDDPDDNFYGRALESSSIALTLDNTLRGIGHCLVYMHALQNEMPDIVEHMLEDKQLIEEAKNWAVQALDDKNEDRPIIPGASEHQNFWPYFLLEAFYFRYGLDEFATHIVSGIPVLESMDDTEERDDIPHEILKLKISLKKNMVMIFSEFISKMHQYIADYLEYKESFDDMILYTAFVLAESEEETDMSLSFREWFLPFLVQCQRDVDIAFPDEGTAALRIH